MKNQFKNGLQILAAVLITGSTAFAMQPTAGTEQFVSAEPKTSVTNEVKAEEISKPEPVVEPKPTTWEDNPNGCDQSTQYIAKEAPFSCIDKPKPVEAPAPVAVAPPSGSCLEWMIAAGVPNTAASNKLIINESGCRPDAINPSSGACGIPQALPCSKMPCTLQDPICQLKWMNEYVTNRYNNWDGALRFWYCQGTCSSNNGVVYNKNTNWY